MFELHEIFRTCYPWPWLGPPLATRSMLCTSDFHDDVTFSHSGPYSAWRWQYRRGRRAVSSSQKFPTYSPGGATLLNIVDMLGAAIGWLAAACGIKAGGEVCYLRLPCFEIVFRCIVSGINRAFKFLHQSQNHRPAKLG